MDDDGKTTGSAMNRWLADERRFYRLLLLVGALVALLKGMHMPYSWPATQAQIDYRYGFLRRGLFGEVCRQLHLPIWRYGVFAALAFALLAACLLLLGWAVRRSGLDAAGMGAFSALMGGSFCLSYLVNIVGFYDIVMAILVLLVLLVKTPRLQLAAVAVAGVVGVLVHELYAIAFLPVSLVMAIGWASEGQAPRRWLGVLCAGLTPWLIVLAIARHAALSPAQGEALKQAVRARVDFEPYEAMLQVLTSSSRDNVLFMLNLMRSGSWWVEELLGMAAFVPTALFFLAIAWRLAQPRGRAVKAWLLMATFSPLLMNCLAFDRYRWLAMVTLNAFFCAIAMASTRRAEPDTAFAFSIGWRRAAVLLLAINLATDVGFFEGRARSVPFRDYWTDYRQAKEAHRPWLMPPELMRQPVSKP